MRFRKEVREQSTEVRRRGYLLLCLAAVALSAVLTNSAIGLLPTSGRSSSQPSPNRADLVAFTSSNCSSSAFCISGGAIGTAIYPGGPTQTIPLTFVNPYSVPITIQTLQVTFTNSFGSCLSSAYQVNGAGTTGTPPSVTISPNFTVAAATSAGPTSASYTGAKLGLADSGNQKACQGLALNMAYMATATYNYTNCVTGNQNGDTVTAGQVLCISKSGKVSGGVTVQAGGVLFVNGGTITGGLSASGAAGINLCGATVNGGATITGASGEVVIGDGQSCGGGTITGGLSVTNGSAGVQIIGNSVTGSLTVSGNTGSIPGPGGASGQFVESNSITGGFTCTPNNTPALNDGNGAHPNSVSGQRSGVQCSGSF